MLGRDWTDGDGVPVRAANRFLLQAGDADQFYLTIGLAAPTLPQATAERPTVGEQAVETERPQVIARLALNRSSLSSLLSALHSGL